jgi:RNA polymerase sigma-70 factor (ECF subfamily)
MIGVMTQPAALREPARASSGPVHRDAAEAEVRDEARLRRIFQEQFAFVWRYLRRMGLSEADADDAAQQVFVVLARKLDAIDPGKERAFLCGTCARVLSELRRTHRRRREVSSADSSEPIDTALGPEDVADRERARAVLDGVLDQMDIKLREVFVLFELEEMSTVEIAELLELPIGTAASRLRRARESFQSIVKRMRARGDVPGTEATGSRPGIKHHD